MSKLIQCILFIKKSLSKPLRAAEDAYLQALYEMQDPSFISFKPGFLTLIKNPSSSKYLKQTSFFFEKYANFGYFIH